MNEAKNKGKDYLKYEIRSYNSNGRRLKKNAQLDLHKDMYNLIDEMNNVVKKINISGKLDWKEGLLNNIELHLDQINGVTSVK